jgi:restriction system protein
MQKVWMVRGDSGRLYEEFRAKGVAAVGWAALAARIQPQMSREQLKELCREVYPEDKKGTALASASQVWRFMREMRIGDHVITYSPDSRTYMLGIITSDATIRAEWHEIGMSIARTVDWQPVEIARDDLSQQTKNSLGSTLTVFLLPSQAAEEMLGLTNRDSVSPPRTATVLEEELADPLSDIELQAIERIKDMINTLDWNDMQELVAGILRAMGYKTQVSPVGADRGKDIIASPDGFGFENPRIVVEVKHRKAKMGSQEIRSFLGGRHKDDRGLYVSTGGFSVDAYYEADRATVPLTLWTLDSLVRALIEHYDSTDTETKRLVPLKRMYWPA